MSDNHYEWLDANFSQFLINLGMSPDYSYGIAGAHGDKAYSYRSDWDKIAIPFNHGVAIFLLSYLTPFRNEVGKTPTGWVDVGDWVIANYERFKDKLPLAN